jgi:hypothetical protein
MPTMRTHMRMRADGKTVRADLLRSMFFVCDCFATIYSEYHPPASVLCARFFCPTASNRWLYVTEIFYYCIYCLVLRLPALAS